jgi:hypothetical protein
VQFAALQAALKENDPDKLWKLLASRSRTDAERAANAVQAFYAMASDSKKSELQKMLGVNGAELAALTGITFLKTKRFQEKYHDVPGSTVERVIVEGESAVVHYLESDGDKEKAVYLQEDGQWKAWLPIPRIPQP